MRALSIPFLVLMAGCMNAPLSAPFGSTVSWDETTAEFGLGDYCEESEPDFTGTMRLYDVLVIDDNDVPLGNIAVEIQVEGAGGVYVLPQEAIKTVDLPAADADVQSAADVRAACVDDNGNFDNTNEWCAWYWDEENQQFYQFGDDYADAGGYAPTYFSGVTDQRGLMRVYVFYDCIVSDTLIKASIGVDTEELTITSDDA